MNNPVLNIIEERRLYRLSKLSKKSVQSNKRENKPLYRATLYKRILNLETKRFHIKIDIKKNYI